MSSSVPDGVAPFGSPPRDVIPSDAALDLVIGRSDSAVVSVSGFRCYPSGFEFTVSSWRRGQPEPPGFANVALQYPDGATTSTDEELARQFAGAALAARLRLSRLAASQGGEGVTWKAEWRYWASPLPGAQGNSSSHAVGAYAASTTR
jgi:hypothetical protein